MKLRYALPTALLLAAVLAVPAAHADTGFTASLSGAQEVGPVATTATGTAVVILNTAQTSLSWTVTYTGLSSGLTASHIHKAPIGVNGGVIFPLNPVGGTTSGSFSGSVAVTAAQAADLIAGLYYINIHTSNFPGGEIRGQLVSDPVPAATSTWGRIKQLYR